MRALRRFRPLAALFAVAVLVPMHGRTQEAQTQPSETTDAPKPDSSPSTPTVAPAEVTAPAFRQPGSVAVPEVVVKPAAPKRVAAAPGPRPIAAAPRPQPAPVVVPPTTVTPSATTPGSQPGPGSLPKPPGQTITTVSGERIKNEPAFTVQDLLQESPGVSFKQGNGPRDIGISIRGSNARNGFGIRNIVVLEDGFPVTQPDGLSRTDLTDPHAYGGVDVYRGPSSAMFGNYATGGAINFRLCRGGEINGVRYGIEGGSFGYLNNYAIVGGKSDMFEGAAVRQRRARRRLYQPQLVQHPDAQRAGTYRADAQRPVTFKVIDNSLFDQSRGPAVAQPVPDQPVPARLHGCGDRRARLRHGQPVRQRLLGADRCADAPSRPASAATTVASIVGLRWEHDFDNQTTWRTQVVFDDKNINQPTGATSADRRQPVLQPDHRYHRSAAASVRPRGDPLLRGVLQLGSVLTNYTWNVAPGGNATLGRLASIYDGGHHVNLRRPRARGGQARPELDRLCRGWRREHRPSPPSTRSTAFPAALRCPSQFADPAGISSTRRRKAGCSIGRTRPGSSAAGSRPATARRRSAI